MLYDDIAQPHVKNRDEGFEELLNAHRAIADAWYSNWRSKQEERLNELLEYRARAAAA